MDTRIYEYILNVEKEKNITRAAEKSFISQPALTQHIKKLEKHYGFPIFFRKDGELLPTKKGKLLLTMAARSVSLEKELYEKIELLKKKTK